MLTRTFRLIACAHANGWGMEREMEIVLTYLYFCENTRVTCLHLPNVGA
jgi:hypothetical protein